MYNDTLRNGVMACATDSAVLRLCYESTRKNVYIKDEIIDRKIQREAVTKNEWSMDSVLSCGTAVQANLHTLRLLYIHKTREYQKIDSTGHNEKEKLPQNARGSWQIVDNAEKHKHVSSGAEFVQW